ncbi:DUF3800 domain-containing protein [Paenibacillus sp. FSL W8-1287]|uniref:DUF3800 domain-containing protein n=1 Tax=Paenibacillus sp. FSL W8-1287 TaxID=2954653 RepID=UPI0030CD8D54
MEDNIFNVYIDEAGDEGFKIKDGKWVSSEWFVVGALIVRGSNDLELSRCVDHIKSNVKFIKTKQKPLHFAEMTHEKKKYVIKCMTEIGKFKCCYVAVNKKTIEDESFLKSQKGYLYNYCIRYLLERVTWLIDEHHGKANLIFENRGNTSFDELDRYLKSLYVDKSARLRKGIIHSSKVINKSQSKNIQLADAVTSSLFKALEFDSLESTEPSYINSLRPFIYNRNLNYHGYGLKFFPHKSNHDFLLNKYPWLKVFTKSVVRL